MRPKVPILVLLVCLLLPTGVAAEIDGVLRVYPVGAATYVATSFPLEGGTALAGIRFFNNDALMEFPELLLLEGEEHSPPDLSDPGLVLLHIDGPSLAWGDLTLDSPVASSTGIVTAVFRYPALEEMSAQGEGGGPGLGVRSGTDHVGFFVSADGENWVSFADEYALAVEPIAAALKGGAPTLASFVRQRETEHGDEGMALSQSRQATLRARPNPFNPRVEIHYELASDALTALTIYDLRGRLVRTLHQEHESAGEHHAIWNGDDEQGRRVASGTYFLVLEADGRVLRQKVLLLR